VHLTSTKCQKELESHIKNINKTEGLGSKIGISKSRNRATIILVNTKYYDIIGGIRHTLLCLPDTIDPREPK